MLHRFPRLVWLVLLIGLIGTSYSTNSSAQGPVIDPAVTKALQTADQVSVIVQLQEPLPLDAPLSARMREIAKRQQSVLAILRSSEFQLVYRYKTVAGFAGKIKKKTALEKLNLHPYVVQIQPDLPVHAIQVQDYRISPSLTQSVPLINANQVHNMGITGAGVRVAVLDTGIDTDHPDLSDDLVAQNCFLDGAGGGCPPPPNVAEDDQGHGTNVSGIITSRGTIAPKGVAPDAKIVAVKVLNAVGSGSFSDVVAAIDWINANNGTLRVKAISMSLGGGLFSGFCDSSFPTMANAINTARNLGITTFAAAGNDGNKSQMSSPGCIQNSVSVGAVYDSNIGGPIFWGVCVDVTTAADQVTCFSNSNETLDILAPGSIITSTGNTGGTSSMSGTSQATPHGSALAALLLQANNALTPAQIESAIKNNGKAVTDPGNNLTRPRIDALAAVNAVLPPVVDIQRPTGASPQLLKQGDSFQVVFSTNKPGNFAIKVNGTTVATGSAASSSNTVNVTLPNPFAEGVYALKVEVTAEFTGADTENGAVRVDNTPPTDPSNVHSTSHTIGPSAAVRITATSNDNTIDMAWNPDATDPVSNGVSSGVDGFSVAFRNGSTPFCDRTKDLEATAISFTSAPLADGTWFFHLCTVDKVGNWTGTVTVGPFVIDTLPPSVDLTAPTTATPQYVKQGDSFTVSFTTNEAGSYAIKVGDTVCGTGSAAAGTNAKTCTLPATFGEGIKDIVVLVADAAANTGTVTGSGAVRVDNSPPNDPTNVQSTDHTVGQTSNDNTISMSWVASTTDNPTSPAGLASGVDGYSVAFRNGSTPFCDRTKDLEATAISFTSAPLADGTWFFHLCTVDKVGNWTGTVTVGPFVIVTVIPTAVFRVERETGKVFAKGAYFCALGSPGPVNPPATPCFNSGVGADLAEGIDLIEQVEPGDVVELDPGHPGHYRKARSAQSPLVAGVISTQPGVTLAHVPGPAELSLPRGVTLVLDSSSLPLTKLLEDRSAHLALSLSLRTLLEGEFKSENLSLGKWLELLEWLPLLKTDSQPLLALMGRVPVKATAENGPIHPGDLLVSASRPGYAMRCANVRECEGAIIGKALETLETGTGMIQMLTIQH